MHSFSFFCSRDFCFHDYLFSSFLRGRNEKVFKVLQVLTVLKMLVSVEFSTSIFSKLQEL